MPARKPTPTIVISSAQSAMRVPRKKLTKLIRFVARAEGLSLGLVDLAVVSSRRMAAINRRYLGHRGATDVLCFDLSDAATPGIACQIVVCGDLAVSQARARSHGPQRELMLYVVHGLLHLMGYDDTTSRAAARIHARERQLLERFSRKLKAESRKPTADSRQPTTAES